jgi:hypothetical protein
MSFTGANLAIALVMFGMMGSMFFFSQYFQSVQGFSAFEAGLRVIPISLFLMVAAGMSPRLAGRFGIKIMVGAGILLTAIGLFYFSQIIAVDTPYILVVGGYAIMAFGMGSTMTPATDSIMGSIPASKAGVGSAMNDTTRQLGGAMGVAVLGTVMNSVYLEHIAGLEANPALSQLPEQALAAINSSIQGAHIVAEQIPVPQLSQLIADTVDEAFVLGMTEALWIGALIAGSAALLTFIILPAKIRRAEEAPEDVSAGVVEGAPTGTPEGKRPPEAMIPVTKPSAAD